MDLADPADPVDLVPPDDRLVGCWERSLLTTADGRRDTTTDVTWLQGRTFYVDLRTAALAADLSGVACLRDLSTEQALALAATEGFAGVLAADGPWARWVRLVDLQPPAPALDEGRLVQHADRVIETGRDGSYQEHWHRAERATTPTAGLLLRETTTGATGVLVRVGEDVGWASGRAVPLTDGRSLAEHVAAAASTEDAQDLLGTEVATGRVGPGGIVLTRTSLPWRTGALLDVTPAGDRLATSDQAADGSAVRRTWEVLAREGEQAHLLDCLSENA